MENKLIDLVKELKKENICVLIENEAHLQEAKELLEKYDEITNSLYAITDLKNSPQWEKFLMFDNIDIDWFLGYNHSGDKVITLSELETILKQK